MGASLQRAAGGQAAKDRRSVGLGGRPPWAFDKGAGHLVDLLEDRATNQSTGREAKQSLEIIVGFNLSLDRWDDYASIRSSTPRCPEQILGREANRPTHVLIDKANAPKELRLAQ